MADYVLEISNYTGTVPWATHFMGRVKGEHPQSCHGGTSYNAPGHRGKTTCQEGHELPGRIEWDVEAAWTEERYERYAARHFEGDGPQQFKTEQEVIETAAGRFLGALPCRWWEEQATAGQPGDKLYAGWIPVTADGQALVQENWGTVIAEVPPESSEPRAIMARPGPPPHDTPQGHGRAERRPRASQPAGGKPDALHPHRPSAAGQAEMSRTRANRAGSAGGLLQGDRVRDARTPRSRKTGRVFTGSSYYDPERDCSVVDVRWDNGRYEIVPVTGLEKVPSRRPARAADPASAGLRSPDDPEPSM